MYANADFYLDQRRPEWRDAERDGLVKFNLRGYCVEVMHPDIAAVLDPSLCATGAA